MKEVTIEQVVMWNPCGLHGDDDGTNYVRARLVRLFDGRDGLNVDDIIALHIPIADKVWALLHWDGARAAAGDAARDAAGAAARDAAWTAGRGAAWDAAWEKELVRIVALIR